MEIHKAIRIHKAQFEGGLDRANRTASEQEQWDAASDAISRAMKDGTYVSARRDVARADDWQHYYPEDYRALFPDNSPVAASR